VTTGALLSVLLSVAIPFVLAVMGGILAVRSLPAEKFRYERWWWVASFICIALLGIVLAFVQQLILTKEQKETEQKASEAEFRLRSEGRYTQGQLDTMTKVLTALASKPTDPSISKSLIQALAMSTQTSTASLPKTFSNQQLWDAAIDLSRRLRVFEIQMSEAERQSRDRFDKAVAELPGKLFQDKDQTAIQLAWNTMTSESAKASAARTAAFGSLRSEAMNMRTQLLNRLPPQPENPTVRMVLDSDVIAGPHPISMLADYIESKARLLDLSK
jgi:hypothetical protein